MASFTLPRAVAFTSLKDFVPNLTAHPGCSRNTKQGGCNAPLRQHRNSNRALRCNAASKEAAKEADYAGELMKIYERETPTITLLLEEIEEKGMVEASVSDATTGAKYTEAEKREAVKAAVDSHFEDFSEGIIMVLAGYAQASYQEGHHAVAETLEMIRQEVLARSLSQLPPEMQALEHLIGMFGQSSEERVTAAKELGKQGFAGIAQADLAALRTTASQMLEDMEEKRSIVNSQLLAKLCIVREEIDVAASELNLLNEDTSYYELMTATWRLLPMGPAAFVKELLHVSIPEKRKCALSSIKGTRITLCITGRTLLGHARTRWRHACLMLSLANGSVILQALLAACIKHDFQKGPGDKSLQRWVEEGVRPGRLMNTLAALLSGLKHEGLAPNNKEVLRLRELKAEAIDLLYDVAESQV